MRKLENERATLVGFKTPLFTLKIQSQFQNETKI